MAYRDVAKPGSLHGRVHLRRLLQFTALAATFLHSGATSHAQPVQWMQRAASGPAPRSALAMSYDSARAATVLFGGYNNGPYFGDTWEWNGVNWGQRAASGPSPRYGHAMCYDSQRGVTVLFGGYNGSSALGDTWLWNGSNWVQPTISGPLPSARSDHAMSYDAVRGVTVMFGGGASPSGNSSFGDTWEWNGNSWTQRTIVGPSPSPRSSHAMVYDAARSVTLLFGGSQGTALGDTWEWNGITWSQQTVNGPSPSPRSEHAMAYDLARGVTTLFGGSAPGGNLSDTWEWNGNSWTQRTIVGPSPRQSHSMAYDVARGGTVLFGAFQSPLLGDTWELFSPPPDCNDNGIPDDLDVLDGISTDCNFNMVPDECEGFECDSPDLVVTSIVVPTVGLAGQSFELRFTVKNVGEVDAIGPWTNLVSYSSDNQIGSDVSVGEFAIPGTLAPNMEIERIVQIMLPGAPGPYHVVVTTDASNSIPELAGESNNSSISATAINVLAVPLPDLEVVSVTQPNNGVTSGSMATVTWVVRNTGTGATSAPQWVDEVIISANPGLAFGGPGGDQVLCNDPFASIAAHVGNAAYLAAGDSYLQSAQIELPHDVRGPYFVYVVADRAGCHDVLGRVAELNDVNNLRRSPSFEIMLEPQADLLAPAPQVHAPSFAASSNYFTVTWTDFNAGDGSTDIGTWTDAVYLSANTNASIAGDLLLGQRTRSGAALGSHQFDAPASLTKLLPAVIGGTHFVKIVVDINDAISELETPNNNIYVHNSPVEITQSVPTNLESTVIDPPVTHGIPAHPIKVTYHAHNIGMTPVVGLSWVDRVYLSADGSLDPNTDTLLGTYPASTVFVNGQYSLPEYIGTVNGVIPATLPAGDYRIIVVVDAANQIDEGAGESDNIHPSSPFPIQLMPTDLQITPGSPGEPVPTSVVAGQTLVVHWESTNTGSGLTPVANWTDAVYLSVNSTLDAGDIHLGSVAHTGELASMAAYPGQGSVTIPATAAGANFLLFVADSNNSVYEQSPGESNNVSAIAVTVVPATVVHVADLVPVTLTVPPVIQPNESFAVGFSVTNNGNVATSETLWYDRLYLSTDAQLGTDDLLLKTITHMGPLGSQQSYSATSTLAPPAFPPGTYYMLVQADSAGQVFEAQESNNVRSMPMTLAGSPVPAANLVVSNVSAPGTVIAGQTLTVTWRTSNAGEAATAVSTWRDAVYLSADSVLGSSDIPLGTFQEAGPLGIGGFRDNSQVFAIPCGMNGPFYIIILADSQGIVPENGRESDNAASSATPTLVTGPAMANLQIRNIAAPASAASGQALPLTWTASNVGGDMCQNGWSDAVFLSRDTILDPGIDVFLGTHEHAMPLSGNSERTVVQDFVIPAGSSGPYFVLLKADYSQQVPESSEADNVATAISLLQVTLSSPGDLVVSSVSAGGNHLLGDSVTFTWQVTNSSAQAVSGAWSDSVYLSADANWDVDDKLVARFEFPMLTLAGGDVIQRERPAILPSVLPGDYHVIVKTDVLNQAIESNNDNNTNASPGTLSVGVRQLPLDVTLSGPLPAGAAQYFALTVPAGETVQIDMHHASPTAWTEMYVRKAAVPTSGQFDAIADQHESPHQAIFIPTTEAATYYIMAHATAGTFSPAGDTMTIVAHAIPFGVTAALPQTLGNGERVTLRIRGSRFVPGITVSLLGPDDLTVSPATVTVVDGQNLRARFDLSSVPFGSYSVRVTDPGGQAELAPQAVLVEPARPIDARISGTGDLTPRAGGALLVNALIVNTSNVDAPVVTVAARVNGEARIGWSRPAESLPRVADFNNQIPWDTDSPTASFADGFTHDAFVLRDLAPGDSVECSTLVTGFVAGPLHVQFGAHAETEGQFAANFFGNLESARQVLVNSNTSNLPPDLQAVVQSPPAWQAHFEGIFANLGYFEPGQHPSATFGCVGMSACAVNEALRALVLEAIGCAPLGPAIELCEAIHVLDFTYGMIECYQRHCSPQCETCVDGHYQWNECSFADVVGSYFTSLSQGCGLALGAIDPNEKIGPTGGGGGGGGQQLVGYNGLQYGIHFQNQPQAQAAAATVTVTDDLDPLLNAGSVRFGTVRLGDVTLTQLTGRSSYQGTVDLTATKGIYLNVFAGVNATNRQVFWIFESIDPLTGLRPNNPSLGILPPDNAQNIGSGFVEFNVSPSPDAGTGAPVRNGAKIKFDSQATIITNVVTHLLDVDRPTSAVAPIPPLSATPNIEIAWTGSDPFGGSNLAGYTVYVQTSTSPLALFDPGLAAPISDLVDTLEQAAIFQGLPGRRYAFYSIARDGAGNVELLPGAADATTYVPLEMPGAAIASLRTSVTIELDLGPQVIGQNNPLDAEYAVVEVVSHRYLGVNGKLAEFPTWRTAQEWGVVAKIRRLKPGAEYALAIRVRGGFEETPRGPVTIVVTRAWGDVNGDGQSNQADVTIVQQALGTVYGQPTFNPAADVDGDDAVTTADLDSVQYAANCGGIVQGDFDGNGLVNGLDVPGLISSILSTTGAGICIGDMNHDGRFDGRDLQAFVDLIL